MNTPEIPQVLLEIAEKINLVGGSCYLVGGWVRDFILGKECKDYDIEIYRIEQSQLDEILKPYGKPSQVGRAFGITLLSVKGVQFDFAFPRTEVKTGAGHTGFEVETDPNLTFEEAAWRRDFTINAMGMKLPELTLEDPYNGKSDLAGGILRHVSEAFGEDPLRALRAVQFAARFKLLVLPETIKVCAEQDLSELSIERVDEEFRKLWLKAEEPSKGLWLIQKMNMYRFFPELELDDTRWLLMLKQVDLASLKAFELSDEERIVKLTSVLLCSVAPFKREAFLNRVTRNLSYIEKSIKLAKAADQVLTKYKESKKVTQGWVRRQAIDVSMPEQVWVVSLLSKNEDSEGVGEWLEGLAKTYTVWEEQPKAWIQGRDMIEMGMKPGPHFGNWIQKSFDLQLDGELVNRAEALSWLKNQLK